VSRQDATIPEVTCSKRKKRGGSIGKERKLKKANYRQREAVMRVGNLLCSKKIARGCNLKTKKEFQRGPSRETSSGNVKHWVRPTKAYSGELQKRKIKRAKRKRSAHRPVGGGPKKGVALKSQQKKSLGKGTRSITNLTRLNKEGTK